MQKEYLEFGLEIKGDDDGKGVIEGHGSVFGNTDFHNDIVDHGAFKKSLAKRMPSLLLHHDSRSVAGIWQEAREDDKGLFLRGQLNMNVQSAKEAYHLAAQGALSGLSIGFYTKSDEIIDGVRHIKEAELLEVSMVTFPANDRARISGVKSYIHGTEREFEAFLRDQGYSRNDAKTIASHGFRKFRNNQRDVDDLSNDMQRDVDNIAKQLQSFNQSLKGNI